ncbi:MAG: class I SAM-dependent methyltransferase [Steroidobacteraceae bacterium]
MASTALAHTSAGLLGDTAQRDYARKLQLFNSFAEPELRGLIEDLDLQAGMHVLDAGCGTGEALRWLQDAVAPSGTVMGIDLAEAHVRAARQHTSPQIQVRQGDILHAPLAPASFDFIWCVNTIHHLHDPAAGVNRLAALLRPGGRIALGQSALLPDMVFAWDSRLERAIHEAVRRYYRDRYRLAEQDLMSVRAILGVLHRAQLRGVTARTVIIERVSPLDAATESYLAEAIFRDTWGERLRPYLACDEGAELARLCDPADLRYALKRPDFHFLQTFTVVTGGV